MVVAETPSTVDSWLESFSNIDACGEMGMSDYVAPIQPAIVPIAEYVDTILLLPSQLQKYNGASLYFWVRRIEPGI